MQALLDKLLMTFFSELPLVKKLDGYKRLIGDTLIIAAAALAALQEVRPELTWVASASAVVGLLMKVIGEVHASAKGRQ